MPLSVAIAAVDRLGGGRIHFRKTNKQGVIFQSAQQALEILQAAREAITDEVLMVAAAQKVGPANIETLAGKTITLRMEIDIT